MPKSIDTVNSAELFRENYIYGEDASKPYMDDYNRNRDALDIQKFNENTASADVPFFKTPQFDASNYVEGDFGKAVSADDFLKYQIAKNPKLTPVQAAEKSFGNIPLIGDVIKIIKGYEDKANYRDADPELRKMMGLE